jgi:hypothetical protein
MSASSPSLKRRWELHAIVCITLLTLGAGIHDPEELLEPFGFAAVLGLALTMAGLFRRSQVAWWASLFLWLILLIGSGSMSVELIGKYGFRAHRLLLGAHALSVVCAANCGLLLSVKIRGAYSGSVQPFWEDSPALQTVIAFLSPIFLIGAAIFSLGVVGFFHARRGSGERSVSTSLKTISTAEADFRANDRDGNHVNDFWTRDVQGLYGIIPADGKEPIKLIEMSVALADSDPVKGVYPELAGVAGMRSGAWFIALSEDRSVTPLARYRDPQVMNSQFGFLAFPDDFISSYAWAWIINENNTIYRRHLKDDVRPPGKTPPGPVRAPGYGYWPSDEELKTCWSTLD